MSQSSKQSLTEAVVNTLVGTIVTFLFSPLIYWMCAVEISWPQMGIATVLFTILSILRNYVIRRAFNKQTDISTPLIVKYPGDRYFAGYDINDQRDAHSLVIYDQQTSTLIYESHNWVEVDRAMDLLKSLNIPITKENHYDISKNSSR